MTVQVVVPFRGGCEWRERALEFVRLRYRWPVTVAEAPPGRWCKSRAIWPAVEASSADVLVIADGDVVCDGIQDAVDAVAHGAPWAIPHRRVHRLNEHGTEAVYAGEDWRRQPVAQWPYVGFAGGGIVVLPRRTMLEVPMPCFEGWGGEDESWSSALRTLVGPPWRGYADLLHLWHPPQERMSRRWGSVECRDLALRFKRADGDHAAMAALVEEVSPCLSPA